MIPTTIQLTEGVTLYNGPQILKLIGPSGAWAYPGTGSTKGKKNIAAIDVRVDETAVQTCHMSVTRWGTPLPDYMDAGTACLGTFVKNGIKYSVDSDCMVQP
jgi:hypothetical protein